MRFAISLLATLLISSAAMADVSTALRGCMNEATSGDTLLAMKTRPNGTSDTVVMLECHGKPAKYLYDQVAPYALEAHPRRNEQGEIVVSRHFGKIRHESSSQCLRRIEEADGRAVDHYSCYIRLDLNDFVVKAM